MKTKKVLRGRPKMVKSRTKHLIVRMTEDELKLIDEAIKRVGGTTRGKFVRSLVLSSI